MPVGRPDPDGDGIVSASRAYRGKTLGEPTIWDCPACGKRNEGRLPEKGCGVCGAGDPTKSRAGKAQEPRRVQGPPPADPRQRIRQQAETLTQDWDVAPAAPPPVPSAPRAANPLRVLRMVEYLIKPGREKDLKNILRRSLVGTIEMDWGAITGTIVDSIDSNQEDRLRLAHLQPGVWISNPTACEVETGEAETRTQDLNVVPYSQGVQTVLNEFEQEFQKKMAAQTPPPEPPDTGPAFSPEQERTARLVQELGGYKLCYTLALALQSIAQELEGTSEPEKFLTSEEALQLANAFMQQVPQDWIGDVEETTNE